jgi:uncharacterized protein (DUF1697 family)
MVFVALLRGINVGGANPIQMTALKAAFEAAGMTAVRTYINSGNVIFETGPTDRARLAVALEGAIQDRFGFAIRVLVRDLDEMRSIAQALPPDCANDATSRCMVLYLWPDIDRPSIVDELPHNPDIEELRYVPGAVLHRVGRENAARSRLTRMAGTPIYRQLTSRNANTARKLPELMGG